MKFMPLEDWIAIGVLLISLLLYLIFAGLEYALLSSNPLALELKRDQKNNSNNSLSNILDNQELFWRTTNFMQHLLLITNTLGIIYLCKKLLHFLPKEFVSYFRSYQYMLFIAGGFITLIIIFIIKRWIAKPIFERKPENKVNFWSKFIVTIGAIVNPIVIGFRKIADFILVYLFNARIDKNAPIFEGVDPNKFYKQAIQGQNVLNQLNKDFFQGAIDLTQVQVRSCITPRTELKAIDIHSSIEALTQKFIETKLSKIIIYDKHLDNIVGYVHHLDLNTNPTFIKEILLEMSFVPEAMSALDMLRQFTRDRRSIALVVDEFGGTTGIVTTEDILEEIFGNIKDEYDFEEFTEKQISDNEYVLSGRLKLDYLTEKYGFRFASDNAETLSGYIIDRHESIPKQKEKIIIGRYEFEILLVSSTKIESVRMRLLKG